MNRSELLGSFVKGFGRTDKTDIINALFVAKNIFHFDFPFDFESRGSRGVDSSEIRKLLFFTKIETKKNHKEVFKVATQLSEVDSKRLGWLAQYVMNGEVHLYPKEAEKARKIRSVLKANNR